MRPVRRAWLLAASAAAFAAVAGGCTRSQPEQELRDAIAAMAQAVEQRRLGDLLDVMADDFSRESGAFGKDDARRMLGAALLRHEKISLTVVVTAVDVRGDSATATVRVAAAGGGSLLPERGQLWEFQSAWRRDRGRWKVFNAEWREAL
jgi:ketosteroid isomerase-like protein